MTVVDQGLVSVRGNWELRDKLAEGHWSVGGKRVRDKVLDVCSSSTARSSCIVAVPKVPAPDSPRVSCLPCSSVHQLVCESAHVTQSFQS